MKHIKSIGKVLSESSPGLAQLLERAAALQQLSEKLQRFLPKALREHVTIANVRGDTVIVVADSPAWLTKLRYQAPVILDYLKQEPSLHRISKLHFKVLPAVEFNTSKPKSRPVLSQHASHGLKQAADGFNDPQLRIAISNIAKNHPHKQ